MTKRKEEYISDEIDSVPKLAEENGIPLEKEVNRRITDCDVIKSVDKDATVVVKPKSINFSKEKTFE